MFHKKSRQWIVTFTLLAVCSTIVLAATTAQWLKDGFFVSSGAITPTANGVPVGNGTAFAVISAGASNTTFLRGDSTWATPAGGGLPVASSGAGTPTILNSSSTTITGTGNVIAFANTAAAATLTSGTGNTIIGNAANVGALGDVNDVAIGNTAVAPTGGTVVGANAGKASATAARFTSIGNTSGAAITSGADNTFVGHNAGPAVTNTAKQTYIGSFAGQVANAAGNTCVGFQAGGSNLTTGTGNTFLGTGTDSNAIGTSSAIVIGTGVSANATKASSTSVVISVAAINSATTNDLYIASGDTGLHRVAAGVVALNTGNGGTTTTGTFLQMAGGMKRRAATQTVTDSTTLTADDTLSVTVAAGRKYSFRVIYYFTTVATSGVKVDMGGGGCTFTSFQGDVAIDNLSTYAVSGGGEMTASTTAIGVTVLGTSTKVEINGGFVCNAGGTFIPRFAQNAETGASESVVAKIDSHFWVFDMP